ncbi:MAG: lipopolysaccharide heptosyltransferase I [Magnetococcales bacterium]|nr:lipopolysaccharide heptosyltransferase I [Magnetococcales bacterium]
MKVLLVKTSSLGDLLHTLPALTDAMNHDGSIEFHWLAEENLAEIPTWHRGVRRVLPLPWRRWRRHPLQACLQGEWRRFLRELRQEDYDAIIDAQGLLKSAIPAFLARGESWGLDRHSAREPMASLWYRHRLRVAREMHAVDRVRALLAQALQYPLPRERPDYGLQQRFASNPNGDYLVFVHGTTWASKHWPEHHWHQLLALLDSQIPVLLPWGNALEKETAERLARSKSDAVRVTEKSSLTRLARILAQARGVVTVDTGPAHLAAALNRPAFCLYGPTDPAQVGTVCQNHHHVRGPCPHSPCRRRLCPLVPPGSPSPCMEAIDPRHVHHWLEALP